MQLKQDFFTQLPRFYSEVTPQSLTDPKWVGWSDAAAHLVGEFMRLMEQSQLDHTMTWRKLGQINPNETSVNLRDDFINRTDFDTWFSQYQKRVGKIENIEAWQAGCNQSNPKYILRNFLAQEAIEAAQKDDFSKLQQLTQVLQHPFEEQAALSAFARKPTHDEAGIIMSCSS